MEYKLNYNKIHINGYVQVMLKIFANNFTMIMYITNAIKATKIFSTIIIQLLSGIRFSIIPYKYIPTNKSNNEHTAKIINFILTTSQNQTCKLDYTITKVSYNSY